MTRQNPGMLLTRPNRATFFSLYAGLAYYYREEEVSKSNSRARGADSLRRQCRLGLLTVIVHQV